MITRQQKKDMDFCTACPKLCRHTCPVGNAECRETVSPWGKMTMLNMVEEGVISVDADSSAIPYKCLGCLLCRSYCEHEIMVPNSLIEGRVIACNRGLAPKGIREIETNFLATGSPLEKDPSPEIRKLLEAKYFEKGLNAVIFAGCMHTTRQPEVIQRLFSLMEKLGVDYMGAFDGSPYCCGLPLYTAGHTERFKSHAAGIAQALSSYKLIVTPCPACAYALKVLYDDCGIHVSARIMHATEFLMTVIKPGTPVKPLSKKRLAYHDPCYLGRHLGIYDKPRQILEACGVQTAEFQWNKEYSYCCGGGGNLPVTSRATARLIADRRRAEFLNLKADAIVTSCPSCETMLRAEGTGIPVIDVIEVAHEAFCSDGKK